MRMTGGVAVPKGKDSFKALQKGNFKKPESRLGKASALVSSKLFKRHGR